MRGKREFCPGDKCKNAWKYANRTGKLKKKEIQDDTGENLNTVKTLIGILTKVTTTSDQCLRVQVDIPVERVNFDTIQYLNQKIVLGFVNEEKDKQDKKDTSEEKDSHFDD
jgi:hypothetical protein